MKRNTKAVVIGGGVIGCSILYHLTKLGWSDVVLLERDELTSGSTWHAAANIHGLHDNTNVSRIQDYTLKLYDQLEQETGQSCGIFHTGMLYIAQTEEREHQLRLQAAKAKLYGLDFHEIGVDEAKRLNPLVDLDGVRCIMFERHGGHVDPSGVTHAYAAGARQRGAEIYRFTPVVATEQQKDGSWVVRTPKGEIQTQWVVNAAGLWAREVGALAGLSLPLQPAEHQYFVTDALDALKDRADRIAVLSDRDGEYYLRQEGLGLLLGAYERDVRLWAEDGTPPDFAHELFDDDLERIEPNLMNAMKRVPELGKAGIKRVINGPMIWSPDSNVLFGPVPELETYFCCVGVIPGFSQSGGMGLMAAQWIIEGETQYDMFSWDIARFGDWADAAFTKARVKDQYANRFAIHFPNEERDAGRPVRTRPIYETQKAMGAVFGMSFGWEHPQWFSTTPGAKDTKGFTRQNWWEPVGEECRMLRDHVGVIDISNFAKYRCEGEGAEGWLNAVFANRMPKAIGRSCLTPLISKHGGIAGDFTVTRTSTNEFWIIGSGIAERYHRRFFKQVPLPEGITFESCTERFCGFNVAGPKSRDMLQTLTNSSLETETFPFMRSKRIAIAGINVLALRVSFTGDLGWELHCRSEDQLALYQTLLEAANQAGGGPVGARALMSLRIEKGYGSWGRDYSPEYWPHECGMAELCKMDKVFLNREATAAKMAKEPRERLVTLALDEADTTNSNADATGGEPIFKGDQPVGRVSSGAYGYTVGMSLALGYVSGAEPGDEVEVYVLGRPHKARILYEPPFDPDGSRLRR